MKKRWLGLLVGLTLCLALTPRGAAAERRVCAPLRCPVAEPLEEMSGSTDQAALRELPEPDYAGAAQALRQGIVDRAEAIDVSQYHIPADRDAVGRLMCSVFYRYGELFVLDTARGWPYTVLGGTVGEFMPAYRADLDAEGYAQAMDFYDQALQAIVDQVPQGFSDAEKVLFIHDYLAANYEYDYDYAIYDAYGFLREGKGVCQAYTLTFSALMDRLGIPVSYVESTLLGHIWNVVELDGTWYHLDVTWDDPGTPTSPDDQGNPRSTDVAGAASHGYFLISDRTNEALRRDWADRNGVEYVNDQVCGLESVTCSDDAYETGPWAQADSPAVYVSGNESWYYLSTDLSDRGLYRWSGNAGEDPVRVGDYSDYYGGVAPLVEYRGCLFFADPDRVRRYELSTGTMDTLCAAEGEAYAYSGFRLEEGRLSVKGRLTEAFTSFDGELLPWHEVDGGLFSYYYDFDQVDIRLGASAEDKCFLVAWHNGATGQMLGVERIVTDGSYPVSGQDQTGTLFILHSDGTWAPVRPKFPLKPQLTTNR